MNVCLIPVVRVALSVAASCLLFTSCASDTAGTDMSVPSTLPAVPTPSSSAVASSPTSTLASVPEPSDVPPAVAHTTEVPAVVDDAVSSTGDMAVVVSGLGMSIVRRNGVVEDVAVPEASLRLTTPSYSEYRLLTELATGDEYPMILVDDGGLIGQVATRYLLTRSKLYETGVVDQGPSGLMEGVPGGRNGSADPGVEDAVIAALEQTPGVVSVERVAPGVLRVDVG